MNVEISEKAARIALKSVQLRLILCENVAIFDDIYTRIRNASLRGAIKQIEDALKKCEEASNANHPN